MGFVFPIFFFLSFFHWLVGFDFCDCWVHVSNFILFLLMQVQGKSSLVIEHRTREE